MIGLLYCQQSFVFFLGNSYSNDLTFGLCRSIFCIRKLLNYPWSFDCLVLPFLLRLFNLRLLSLYHRLSLLLHSRLLMLCLRLLYLHSRLLSLWLRLLSLHNRLLSLGWLFNDVLLNFLLWFSNL